LSRVGKNPVEIPKGVTVSRKGDLLAVKGPKGELKMDVSDLVKVEIEKEQKDFFRIYFTKGKIGWLKKSDVAVI